MLEASPLFLIDQNTLMFIANESDSERNEVSEMPEVFTSKTETRPICSEILLSLGNVHEKKKKG